MTQRLHTAIIEREADALTYQYMCQEQGRVPPLAVFRKEVQLHDVAELASRLVRSLGGAQELTQLRELGWRLYDKLVPSDLAEKLTAESERSYLVLYLGPNLTFVPWELLFDGAAFLCERFYLSRLLEKSSAEHREAQRRMRDNAWGRGLLVLVGDVQGLTASAERTAIQEVMTEALGGQIWFYAARTSGEALELLKQNYDICHFIGHGVYDESSRAASGWRFPDGSILSVEDLERVSSQAIFPRLIFANSCLSAPVSASENESYVTALYRAFLSKGVPQYIGALSRIPDEPSVLFSSTFYAALGRGAAVGEAIWQARDTLRNRSDSAWASYVAHGDPTYRLLSEPVRAGLGPGVLPREVLVPEELPLPQTRRFVDREQELSQACSYLDSLRTGRPAVILVSGEAGAGKTAFLDKVITTSKDLLPGLIPIACASNLHFGIADPYVPFRHIFSQLYRSGAVLRNGETKTVGEFVTTEVMRYFPHVASVFRPEHPAVEEKIPREVTVSSAPDQVALFDQVRRVFDRIGSISPLLIAIDNLHWADESSMNLFYHLASSLRSPVCLLATYRPQAVARSRSGVVHPLRETLNELRRSGTHTIQLDYSSTKAIDRQRLQTFAAACVEAEFPGHCLPQSFVEKLALHTGGNALFITELLKYARDKGAIVRDPRGWKLVSEEDFAELPESVEALIENRIADVTGDLREMLTLASVEGEDFTAEVLARLQNLGEDQVLSKLVEDLYRMHRLVEETGERELGPDKVLSLFHFQNTLVRQHLYKDLSLAQRRRLHKKVGECMEALYGEKVDQAAGQLAAHFRIAREHTKALTYALRAAESSTLIYAYREAIRYYQMALELLELATEKDLPLKKKVLYALAEICKYAARFPEAKVAYEEILRLDPLDRSARGYALNGLGDIQRVQGYVHEALPLYQECEALACEISDEKLLCEVWTDLTDLSRRLAEDAGARGMIIEQASYRADVETFGTKALAAGEALQAWNNLRRVYETYGTLALEKGNTEQAENFYQKALGLAQERKLVKKVLCNLGELRRSQGRNAEALSHYRAYLEWALKTGATRHEIFAYHNIGMTYVAEKDYEQARDFFDKSIQLNTPVRTRTSAALSLAMKGYTFEVQGAREAAFVHYRQSVSILGLESDEEKIYRTVGRMLVAYEPQFAHYFLSKYLEQDPSDADAVRELLNKSPQPDLARAAAIA